MTGASRAREIAAVLRSILPPGSLVRFAAPGAASVRVTARGALLAMFTGCLIADLLADWLQLEVLIGLGFCAVCLLAPGYVRRPALLYVAVAPPAMFAAAVAVTQALTAQGTGGHAWVLSVLEGSLLTLAAVAPWLFAGTVLCLAAAMLRGLPESARDFSADLRGGDRRTE